MTPTPTVPTPQGDTPAAGESVLDTDFLHRLRAANITRDAEYRAKTNGEPLPILFRTTEFAGEAGELLNVVKKLERERLGWGGKRATREMLLEEFGGVVATLDLLAMTLGVDLAEATAAEFNAVTDRLALTTRLAAAPVASPVRTDADGVREAAERVVRCVHRFSLERATHPAIANAIGELRAALSSKPHPVADKREGGDR